MSQTPKHLGKHAVEQPSRQEEKELSVPRHLKTANKQPKAQPVKADQPENKPDAKPKRKKWPIIVIIVVVVLLGICGGGVFAWKQGVFEDTALGPLTDNIATLIVGQRFDTEGATAALEENVSRGGLNVCKGLNEDAEQIAANTIAHDGFPTPLLAEYDGVKIHSPIHPSKLTGIIFHQAAGQYGLSLSTKLPEADEAKVAETKNFNIAKLENQTEGDEYIKAKALHLWRRWTPTEMDSSIDVGGEAGNTVYAPVTGTVVLVRTYTLYDTCEDYEVHIQPDGRDDLDVVEIHIDDVCVKAGDKVEGGVTPIAKVRDLAAEDITDIQLSFYTKSGTGNHTHVQVNNTNWTNEDGKTYRELRLGDAFKVKN